MLTATGTFITAGTGKERYPVVLVITDPKRDGSEFLDPGIFRDIWSDTWEGLGDIADLTAHVESVDLDESLATDLPAGARTGPGGLASAEATIVLAGSVGGMRLAQVFGAYDNPLSVLAPRIGLPVRIELGFTGSIGDETLPQFTGKVRSCHVDPDNGNVTLTVLDNAERFRTPVALPVVFADDHGTTAATSKRPGLNAQWLIDAIARRQGFYASPPIRAQCILSATMHGSAWPEVGTLIRGAGINFPTGGQVVGPATFSQFNFDIGLLGMTCTDAADQPFCEYSIAAGMNTNNGSNAYVQAWRVEASTALLQVVHVREGPGFQWSWSVQVATGHVYVNLTRSGASAVQLDVSAAALTASTVAGHFLAVHLAFTAAGANVKVRVDSTDYTGTLVVANSTGCPDLVIAQVQTQVDAGVISDIQVTTEPYVAGMQDDDFAPTAILEPSLNELTSTPIVDTTDPWLIGQQIADAEQGILTFVDDVLHFFNQAHLTGGAAVATITTDPSVSFANLKQSATSDEQIDTVSNVISGSATPYILDAASTVIWSLGEVMSVPAGGSLTIPAEFPGPVYALASLTHRASKTTDGTGGDITNLNITWTAVTASSYIITASNPNAFAAYIVGNLSGGTPGEPTLNIVGRCTRPSEFPYLSVATDAASVALYGSQPLDLTDNPFRQSAVSLAAFTAALLANLKDPHPEIGDLEIVGEPRLQLTDRVRVSDPDGLILDNDMWLVGRKTRYSANDGLAQSVSMRQA